MSNSNNDEPSTPRRGSHAGVDKTSSSTRKKASNALLIVGIALIVVAVAIVAFIIVSQVGLQKAQEDLANNNTALNVEKAAVNENTNTNTNKAVELVDNPVNFAEVQAENSDIYSWLYIPNTNINYPVLQSAVDDNYYLQYNVDGYQSIEGALYTQSMNKKDYSDPVTVIYGHNIYQPEMMFHQLHLFEDADFFNENDTFYIYTPGHILTYQIIAAYEYDNRHIMNSFDFTKTDVRAEYFDYILHPDSLVANVRAGATLATTDRIVQLSTCVESGNSASRYIVTGKLINDQLTK